MRVRNTKNTEREIQWGRNMRIGGKIGDKTTHIIDSDKFRCSVADHAYFSSRSGRRRVCIDE